MRVQLFLTFSLLFRATSHSHSLLTSHLYSLYSSYHISHSHTHLHTHIRTFPLPHTHTPSPSHTHTQILSSSSLLQSYSDHLWSIVKTAHERDLMHIMHNHKVTKGLHSSQFPGIFVLFSYINILCKPQIFSVVLISAIFRFIIRHHFIE